MSPIVEPFASLMASRAYHLPFLPLLVTLFSIFIKGKSVRSSCASFDCGNGLILGYPFWQQNQQPAFCGYPNLSITCTDNQPVLHIAHEPYRVKSFDDSENTLTVTSQDEANNPTTTCPILTRSFTLSSSTINSTSFLNFTEYNKIVHLYYSCTLYPPSVPDIKCLQRGAERSYAFVDGSVPEFNWIQYCETLVTVPLIDKAVDDLVANGSAEALKQGFKLTWKPVDKACELCEDSGGFCGYTFNSSVDPEFMCFCKDGHQSQNCRGAGEISITSHPNYGAIGAVSLGGLLAISTVVYLIITRRRIGVQKCGFIQIPNIMENSAN